jgi:hypothetical protein
MEKYVELARPSGRMRGMLHLPERSDFRPPWPAVALYHGFTGSRTEARFLFVSFSRLLARHGIASARFDFLDSGESDGEFQDMTLSGEIEDEGRPGPAGPGPRGGPAAAVPAGPERGRHGRRVPGRGARGAGRARGPRPTPGRSWWPSAPPTRWSRRRSPAAMGSCTARGPAWSRLKGRATFSKAPSGAKSSSGTAWSFSGRYNRIEASRG